MWYTSALISLFLFSSCAIRTAKSPAPEKSLSPKVRPFTNDKFLKALVKKDILRKGKFSTVTDQDITTERYVRKDGETVLTLEKDELRTETEKAKTGKILTRTWQDGKLTTLTISGSKRTTMVLLDGDQNFVHKIITEKGKSEPLCFEYEEGQPSQMEASSCLELLSGFD